VTTQADLFQETSQKFCIDACAILDFWGSMPGYPRPYDVEVQRFNKLWNHIASQIEAGVIILPRVIYDEVVKTTKNELAKWLKKRRKLFVDYVDAQQELAEIVNKVEFYTTSKASLHDAILIAVAKKRKITVITSEKRASSLNLKKPKIPNVCEEIGVDWLSLVDYFKQEGL